MNELNTSFGLQSIHFKLMTSHDPVPIVDIRLYTDTDILVDI